MKISVVKQKINECAIKIQLVHGKKHLTKDKKSVEAVAANIFTVTPNGETMSCKQVILAPHYPLEKLRTDMAAHFSKDKEINKKSWVDVSLSVDQFINNRHRCKQPDIINFIANPEDE